MTTKGIDMLTIAPARRLPGPYVARVQYISPITSRYPRQEAYVVLPDAPAGREWVQEIDESTVPDLERRSARLALSIACEALRIPQPQITWFASVHGNRTSLDGARYALDPHTLGYMDRRFWEEIFVRAGQGLESVRETVAHESVHCWQAIMHGPVSHHASDAHVEARKAADERQAIEMARRILASV